MPLEEVPGHSVRYHLIAYDAHGNERAEGDGHHSTAVLTGAAADPPTDAFVFSHGWNGDMPAARRQYGEWISTMLDQPEERERLAERPGGFRPLLIGLHWPSKAWGDEELGSSSFEVAPSTANADLTGLVDRYTERLGDTPAIREALRTIVTHALDDAAPLQLPEPVRQAYTTIDAELSLGGAGEGAAPGDDREPFDAEAMYQACQLEEVVSFGGPSLGGLLAPLRTLTFWQMKRRARDFGETGAARLLDQLHAASPSTRIHLMGHSFGCIVASGAIAGKAGSSRPVSSLVLVQGAMSLWSFCSSIPARPDRPGYFHRIAAQQLVTGPTVVTTSPHDRAVGVFFPIGAGVSRQVDFGPAELPTYGGIGTFGIRGPGLAITDGVLNPAGGTSDLRPGHILNLDATEVIKNGSGASGAHSDICHPAVAQAVWQAASTIG